MNCLWEPRDGFGVLVRCSSGSGGAIAIIPEVKAEAWAAGLPFRDGGLQLLRRLPWKLGAVLEGRREEESGEEGQACRPPGGQVRREEAAVESQRAAFQEDRGLWTSSL